METIRIELSHKGKINVIWVTLGDKKDIRTFIDSIDEAFDAVEDRHAPKKKTV